MACGAVENVVTLQLPSVAETTKGSFPRSSYVPASSCSRLSAGTVQARVGKPASDNLRLGAVTSPSPEKAWRTLIAKVLARHPPHAKLIVTGMAALTCSEPPDGIIDSTGLPSPNALVSPYAQCDRSGKRVACSRISCGPSNPYIAHS